MSETSLGNKTLITYNKYNGVRFERDNGIDLAEWCGGELRDIPDEYGGSLPVIFFQTEGSRAYAVVGDWIVRDEDGDHYGFSNEDFLESFTIAGWHKE